MTGGKLVRDRIPGIILEAGKTPRVDRLSENAYRDALRAKLHEEMDEFLASGAPEELADILEVIYAIAHEDGLTPADLETLRVTKREARGGFDRRLYLRND